MTASRRDFFGEAAIASLLAAFVNASALAGISGNLAAFPTPQREGNPFQQQAWDFWYHFYNSVDPNPALRQRGGEKLLAPKKKVEFLHCGANGLRDAAHIKDEELMDSPNDIQVSMLLGQVRVGTSDQSYLKNVSSSQLRLDCSQTRPYMELAAPLVWTAMAALKPTAAGVLPSLAQLGFHSPNLMSGDNKVMLTGGRGKMALNVYSLKGESKLDKLIKYAAQGAQIIAPVMSLPAISVPAIKALASIWDNVEEQGAVLMNSNLTDVVASQQALGDPDLPMTNTLRLVSGDYALVPTDQLSQLQPQMANLKQLGGYLVPADASETNTPEQLQAKAIPDVTYITLKVSVSAAATASPSSSSPTGAAGGGGALCKAPAKPPAKKD